jgi:hypothetical protein
LFKPRLKSVFNLGGHVGSVQPPVQPPNVPQRMGQNQRGPNDEIQGQYQGQGQYQNYQDGQNPVSPSPAAPGNYQDDSGNQQWQNASQANPRMTQPGNKPIQGQSYRGQNQMAQGQNVRRNVPLGGHMENDPTSQRTLSSNSSEREDGNWNSPMAPEPQGVKDSVQILKEAFFKESEKYEFLKKKIRYLVLKLSCF